MSEKRIAVKVEGLTKSFKTPLEASSGLKQKLINLLKGKKGYREFTPLKDISFEIEEGDFFGIVGRNGSGKSTLLKSLAGIYAPNEGTVTVNGKLVPFIELGVGFNPELTGRENVFLNGALLGFSHKEMEEMYGDIVDFAELHDFMEESLKNYSSGMQVRLAFSIAIRAKGDILLLDEVLAVGDEAFQRKCFSYFAELKKEKRTVVLVTHSMDAVQQFCTKAIMIEKGEVVIKGDPAKVAQGYRELFSRDMISSSGGTSKSSGADISADINRNDGMIEVDIGILPKGNYEDSIITVFIDRDNGEQVYRFATDERSGGLLDLKSGQATRIKLKIQDIFPNGIFSIRVSIKSHDRTKEYALAGDLASFEIDRRIETGMQWDIHWQPSESFDITEGVDSEV